MKPGNKNQTE